MLRRPPPPCRSADGSQVTRPAYGLQSRGRTELREDRRHVVADGLLRQVQPSAISAFRSPSSSRSSTSTSRSVRPRRSSACSARALRWTLVAIVCGFCVGALDEDAGFEGLEDRPRLAQVESGCRCPSRADAARRAGELFLNPTVAQRYRGGVWRLIQRHGVRRKPEPRLSRSSWCATRSMAKVRDDLLRPSSRTDSLVPVQALGLDLGVVVLQQMKPRPGAMATASW